MSVGVRQATELAFPWAFPAGGLGSALGHLSAAVADSPRPAAGNAPEEPVSQGGERGRAGCGGRALGTEGLQRLSLPVRLSSPLMPLGQHGTGRSVGLGMASLGRTERGEQLRCSLTSALVLFPGRHCLLFRCLSSIFLFTSFLFKYQ